MCGDIVSFKDFKDLGGKLQQLKKWKSSKEQEKKQDSSIFRTVTIIEKHNIPKSFVLNSDQTPSKHLTLSRTKTAPKNSTRVGLAGSNNKRSITLILIVTFGGNNYHSR